MIANNKPQDSYDEYYVKQFHALNKRLMDSGESPLLKKGIPERETPYDPVSGVVHDNMNGMFLDNISALKKFKDPRWVRATDMAKDDFYPKRGEKPAVVAYHNKYNDPAKGLDKTLGEKRYYFVYNAEQIRNYPSIEKDKSLNLMKLKAHEKMVANVNKNTPKGRNPLDVVRDMVMQSQASEKELAFAYAAYRHSQDLRSPYVPYDQKNIIEQSKASKASVLKSAYFGGTQAKKMSNADMAYTDGKSRAYTNLDNSKDQSRSRSRSGYGY